MYGCQALCVHRFHLFLRLLLDLSGWSVNMPWHCFLWALKMSSPNSRVHIFHIPEPWYNYVIYHVHRLIFKVTPAISKWNRSFRLLRLQQLALNSLDVTQPFSWLCLWGISSLLIDCILSFYGLFYKIINICSQLQHFRPFPVNQIYYSTGMLPGWIFGYALLTTHLTLLVIPPSSLAMVLVTSQFTSCTSQGLTEDSD